MSLPLVNRIIRNTGLFFTTFFLSFHRYAASSHVTHLQTVPCDRRVSDGCLCSHTRWIMTFYFLLSGLELVSLSRGARRGESRQVVHLWDDLQQQWVEDSQSREARVCWDSQGSRNVEGQALP